jgi:hypothetical protein
MNYMISRDGQEYGPYSLGDLQRYVASGEILLTDMTRSEGMTESMPVSQVIGTIAVPAPATYAPVAAAMAEFPDPPNLHWGLVLLFNVLTCGMFDVAWGIVLGVWMRKVSPQSKAVYYYGAWAVCLVAIFFTSFMAAQEHSQNPLMPVFQIVSFILALVARYSLRSSLEDHYNSAEPMGLALSGVMTFFFDAIYFQYHINDIIQRKNFDRMSMYSA